METPITTIQQHIDEMMKTAALLQEARRRIGKEYDSWCKEFGREESVEILNAENSLLDAIHSFSQHVALIMLYGMHDELHEHDVA